jgi:hypothetical protein
MGDKGVQFRPVMRVGYSMVNVKDEPARHYGHFGIELGMQKGVVTGGLNALALVNNMDGFGGGFYVGVEFGKSMRIGLSFGGGLLRFLKTPTDPSELCWYMKPTLDIGLPPFAIKNTAKWSLGFYFSGLFFIGKKEHMGFATGLKITFGVGETKAPKPKNKKSGSGDTTVDSKTKPPPANPIPPRARGTTTTPSPSATKPADKYPLPK